MTPEVYDDSEQYEISARFTQMLWDSTKDGGKKRARGEKPVWKVDPSHEGAIFSHIAKWKKGEKVDPDSGAHPLVHAAWRCLAIAYQETEGLKAQQSGPTSVYDVTHDTWIKGKPEAEGERQLRLLETPMGQQNGRPTEPHCTIPSYIGKPLCKDGKCETRCKGVQHSEHYYNKPRVV